MFFLSQAAALHVDVDLNLDIYGGIVVIAGGKVTELGVICIGWLLIIFVSMSAFLMRWVEERWAFFPEGPTSIDIK